MTVYKDEDFDLSKVALKYYRKIKEADIEGYIKTDGTPSENIDTEIPDSAIPIVTMALVKLFSLSSGDVNNYQISNSELFSDI